VQNLKDGGLNTKELGVSLTKSHAKGVSGHLIHQIADRWPRSDPVDERVGTGAR
jgi:hypothetical protein